MNAPLISLLSSRRMIESRFLFFEQLAHMSAEISFDIVEFIFIEADVRVSGDAEHAEIFRPETPEQFGSVIFNQCLHPDIASFFPRKHEKRRK